MGDGYVKATRVDRPDEGLATEQLGPGGNSRARAQFDSGEGKATAARQTAVFDTTLIAKRVDDALVDSAPDEFTP